MVARIPWAWLAALALFAGTRTAAAQEPMIGVDARIELLTIVFRLAGNHPEYNQCRVPAYAAAIDRWFAPVRDHEAIRRARGLRDSAGIGFDAIPSLAIHLTDPPALAPRRPLADDSATIDRRWRGIDPAPFLAALRRFATEGRFAEFAASENRLYGLTTNRLREFVRAGFDHPWYQRYFGATPALDVRFVPGICNGGANYGPRFFGADRRLELYAILGIGAVDSLGAPVFEPSMLPTMIHEVNHSFVNPVMERHRALFEAPLPEIHRAVAEDMRAMAYGSWETMLAESLVRAAVVRYLLQHRGERAALREIAAQEGAGFVWMGELTEALKEYETDRARWPTFSSFAPRLAEYFGGLAPRVAELVRLAGERAPKIVSMSPAPGADEVDPATDAIVVRFDRPMGGGYSINPATKGDVAYPEDGPVRAMGFDSTRTVFTWRVQLRPERQYEMVLTGQGFRGADGRPLRRVTYTFRTSKARPSRP
ncbi:MAG: DUF4932 domain-containing protein [Gemmatimonadales bacterium]|nr:DUF4932 domain-containing protein [Gemmatimonadales bacterium]